MAAQRSIVFLSDFGHRDPFVGICHAVIARHDPSITVIDLTHGIEPQNVVSGGVALADALPFLPERCVVLAVVDPGVGGDRRAVAIEAADGRIFVGPDNGLLGAAVHRAGGAIGAVDIGESAWRLEPVSKTFHGRDIFSPVAARLAGGAELSEAGTPIDPSTLKRGEYPTARVENDLVLAFVLDIDTYGNIRLDATEEHLFPDRPFAAIDTDQMSYTVAEGNTYTDGLPDELILLTGSSGRLELSLNRGSAAELLGVESGDVVKLLFE